MTEDLELLRASKAWPVVEAGGLIERLGGRLPAKGFVLFETGYGPSGLPHIGTFAEVFRTSLVRRVFELLSGWPTKLYAFSDDMDGLRAVPDNIPDREKVAQHLHKPLTAIPDPFGTAVSYGANMNQRLKSFLDGFGFDYEFVSATECYRSGRFNDALRRVLERHDAILRVVLPTLGPERRETYSPILPICPETGRVLQVPILKTDPEAGTVTWRNEAGRLVEQSVLDGRAKLQWRPDWAMRWAALGVDYEMYGKDLIDSAKLSGQICKILGGTPPAGFAYEMFLDDQGQKISKSKGNGLTCDQWLTYGTKESLKLFMYQAPRKAKRLYFDVIPRNVDDYFGLLDRYPEQTLEQRYHNPVWHIHGGQPPAGRPADQLRDAAQPRLGRERRGERRALGLHQPLRPRCHARRTPPFWTSWSGTRSPTTGTSSSPRSPTGCPPTPSGRRSPSSPAGSRRSIGAQPSTRRASSRAPRRSSRRSTRSASATASPPTCAAGSRRSTRSCSGRPRGRALAPSSRSTARPRPPP